MANGAHPLGIHAAAAPPSPSASSTFARHQQHHQQQQQHHQQQQQQQHHQLLQQHQQHQLLQHRLQQQQHHLQQQQGLFLHQIAGSPGGGAAVAGMDQAMATATSEGESLDARSPDADRAESTVREGEGAGSAGGGGGASGPAGGVGAGKAIGAASGGGGSGGGGAGAGPGPGATAGRGKQKDSFADWSNGAIHSLLDAFTEKNEELNGRNLRGRDWEEVTSAVNARGDGSKPVKSVLQCRNKLDNLKKRHKIEKDKMFTTGNLKTKWQWFVKMDAIVGRTAKQPRPGPSVPASLALAIAEEIPRLPSSSSPQATTGAGASTQTPATAAAASLSLQHQQQQPTPSSSDPKKKARKKMKLTTSQLLQHDAELADGDIEFPGMSTRPPGMDDYSRTVPQNPYAKVTEPTLQAGHLRDLPGFTRSVYEREYALIAPESQVYSPLPGWMNTLGAYLITPAIGSHFSMYLAQMKGNSTSAPPLVDVERFIFVVKGELQLSTSSNEGYNMHVDWFAYLPPNMQHSLKSAYSATIVVFERRYIKDVIEQDGPKLIVGITDKLPVLETPGEVFALRKLLPTSSIYDFNIHVMDFQPGEFLNVKEVHYFQHGLLLLEGRGIYRLGDKWHPVQAGDVIWMAPFVPQWYAALGRTRSRYLLYKDVNRDPLLHPY